MKRSRRAIASLGAGLQKINPKAVQEFIWLSLGGSVEGE
jgi:D-hexose-6-phosphate mutarotase